MNPLDPTRYRTTALALSLCASLAHAQSERAGRVDQTLEFAGSQPAGTAVFALGDLPELGAGDVTHAARMIEVSPGQWRLPVAVPEGEGYTLSFWRRTTAHSTLPDPANGTLLQAEQVVTAPAAFDPYPEPQAKRAFVQTIGHDPVLYWRPVGTATYNQTPMELFEDLGTGRRRFVAHSWSEPGAYVELYVLGSDFRIPRIGTAPTYADAFALTDTQLRPDLPPPNQAEAPFVRQRFAVPTTNVPHTLTGGRGVEVLLPWNYNSNTTKRYPVLYMHDGQNVFKPGGPFGTWAVEDACRLDMVRGIMREVIVVGIDNSPYRSNEYVPDYPSATVDNDDYNRFIVEDLKPSIDATYRTLPGRETTGVAGSSFGGVASLIIAMDYPEVFGRVGAFSTSFWTGTVYNRCVGGDLTGARVYLDAGTDNDGLSTTQQVRDSLLTAHGYRLGGDFYFQVGNNQAHNEAAWSQRVDECLAFLFPAEEGSRGLYALAPDPGWDRDGDGNYTEEDLYLHEAEPSDTDLDADVDTDDSAAVERWLRRE